MSIIRWEDPPDRHRTMELKWHTTAGALRDRVGQWAVLLESANSTQCSSLVQYIKRGEGPFAPKGSFEALSRSVKRGEGNQAVYARFVGEAPS